MTFGEDQPPTVTIVRWTRWQGHVHVGATVYNIAILRRMNADGTPCPHCRISCLADDRCRLQIWPAGIWYPLATNISERSSSTKLELNESVKRDDWLAGYITLAGNQQWGVWCCLAWLIFLLSCTPHLFTSQTMVHRDRTRWCHTACGGFLCTTRSSEGIVEETKHTKCSLFKI